MYKTMTLSVFLGDEDSSAWHWGTLPEGLGRKASSTGSRVQDLAKFLKADTAGWD